MIPGAVLDPSCRRRPGDQCDYTCEEGYVHSHYATADCTRRGTWMQRLDSLCIPIFCPISLDNGFVAFPCSRQYGEICNSYKCYAPYVKTHMPLKLECKASGTYYTNSRGHWEWDKNMGEPCVSKTDKCPSTFRNGYVSRNCHLQPGAECSYSCDLGCDKDPTVSKLHCGLSNQWNENTDNLCTNCRRCPNKIANGRIISYNCRRLPTSSCSFTCNYGCHETVDMLYCTSEGAWHITNPCICSAEGTDGDSSTDTDDTESSMSAIIIVGGVIIGGLVLVFLVGMACWCQCRRMNLQATRAREHTLTVPMIIHSAPPGDGRSATAHGVPDSSHGVFQYRADEMSGQPPSYEQVVTDPSRFKA